MEDRYIRLVDYYFENGFDKVDAAKKFGLAQPQANAARLFKRKDVQAEIARRRKRIETKLELDRDWIVQRLMRIADAGFILAKYKKVTEDGKLDWDFTGASQEELALVNGLSVEVYHEGRGPGKKAIKKFKIDASDPKGALDSLARILGLFEDKVEVKGEISLIERIRAGRDRLAKEYRDGQGKESETSSVPSE